MGDPSPAESRLNAPLTATVCRDFLRNVCHRGKRCRFLHPADPTAARCDVIASSTRHLVFCHDFQNASGCRRGPACRFVHCTRDEEATYRRTGILPAHVHRKFAVDEAIARSLWRGEIPVCMDFLKGKGCQRADGKCRYRHITADEFEREQTTLLSAGDLGPADSIVYRKRKAPSLDNDDENDEDPYFAVASMNPSPGKQLLLLTPAAENQLYGRERGHELGQLQATRLGLSNGCLLGGSYRLVAVQPMSPLLPSPGFGLLAVNGACNVAMACDRTPVAGATVAMTTNVGLPRTPSLL